MNRYPPTPAAVSTAWIKLHLTRMDSQPRTPGPDTHPEVTAVDTNGDAHPRDALRGEGS